MNGHRIINDVKKIESVTILSWCINDEFSKHSNNLIFCLFVGMNVYVLEEAK